MNTLAIYLKSLPSKILSREEEKELFEKYFSCNDEKVKREVKEKIINHNLRYVVDVAKKMARNSEELQEYIGYGNDGIMEAFDHYNLDKDCAFITYANHWIKLEIRKGMKNSKSISIPQHIEEQIIQLKAIMNSLVQTLDREPTAKEISIMFDRALDEDTIEDIMVQAEYTYKNPISLDTPLSVESEEESSKSLYYDLCDNNEDGNDLNKKLMIEAIREALNELKSEEREIIVYRFYENMTRKEIQDKLEEKGRKLSTERIRQIENKVLEKLSKNDKIKELREG